MVTSILHSARCLKIAMSSLAIATAITLVVFVVCWYSEDNLYTKVQSEGHRFAGSVKGQAGLLWSGMHVRYQSETAGDPSSNSSHIAGSEMKPEVAGHEKDGQRFAIRAEFTLPLPAATLPIADLLQQEWVKNLQQYLRNIPHNSPKKTLITTVSCDSKFQGVLLNWLVSALIRTQPPLSNILFLALDKPLQRLMGKHGIGSIYMEGKDLLPANRIRYIQSHARTPQLPLVMIWRVTVLRLLNHWGYDVANYDPDAIILKNTEQLYYGDLRNSTFIGSRAHWPPFTRKLFGVSVCEGAFMIKSSPETEKYWKAVSQAGNDGVNAYDDQIRTNAGLLKMHLEFNRTADIEESRNWVGKNKNGFTVTVLPYNTMCRGYCDQKKKDSYYVWHHHHKLSSKNLGTNEGDAIKADNNWFLRKDWLEVAKHSSAIGIPWLAELMSD